MKRTLEQKLNDVLDQIMHHSMRTRLTYGRPFGLRSLEALCLEILLKQEKAGKQGSNPSQISASMQVRGPVVSPVLSSLEKQGYIQRRQDQNDRRCRLVFLTEQGRNVAQQFTDGKHQRCSAMVEYLGEEDAREFIRILNRLSEHMEQSKPFEEGGKPQ
ncbi:MAG: winged helix-turn-helix transcriptional regulator [Oscillospiraceae bacterium]|nr:winged helix-turn-helix transcriptional regulator [Oscillospiraceae bacterium]